MTWLLYCAGAATEHACNRTIPGLTITPTHNDCILKFCLQSSSTEANKGFIDFIRKNTRKQTSERGRSLVTVLPLVSYLNSVAFARPIMGKHDVIHQTGST